MFIGGSRSNSAPTRNTPSYGRGTLMHPKPKNPDDERFRVSDTESSQPSVTLKVKFVGLEEYQERLKKLVELVEEINNMNIDIQTSGKFEL